MDMRLPPLRCWSCNKPMQEAWTAFSTGAREGKDQKLLLNSLGLARYCCRRMILTQPLPLKHDATAATAAHVASAATVEPSAELSAGAPPSAPKRKAARRS
jgi:DNA-directed RNA polymerase subunit N